MGIAGGIEGYKSVDKITVVTKSIEGGGNYCALKRLDLYDGAMLFI